MKVSDWSGRKRLVVLVLLCVVVAAAVGVSVAAVDDYARREVAGRAQAEYFERLSDFVVMAVREELTSNGCSNVQAGVDAARQFLKQERHQMRLDIRAPDWGWQVERYRFTIRWRNSWIAKFKIDQAGEARVLETNREFEGQLREEVCPPACGGIIVCWLGDLFGV